MRAHVSLALHPQPLSRALEVLHQPQAQLGLLLITWQAGTAPLRRTSGGWGVTDGWTEAQALVPAPCLHPWLSPGGLGAGTGLCPWLRFLLGKAGPVESRNVRFWDSGWLLPFQGQVSLSRGCGGGEPAGAGPFPWGPEGLLGLDPARPPWATLLAAGSAK